MALVRPLLLPYCPIAHGEHTADPGAAYRPAGHSTAVLLVDPAGHE